MVFDSDTSLGGPRGRFPSTRPSLVEAASSTDPDHRREALGAIVGAYWKPIYKYIRVQWRRSNEDAKDLTQAFLSGVLDDSTLASFDPARASFRTYIRVCVDGFVAHELEAANRLKRGGGHTLVPLDDVAGAAEIPASGDAMEECFHREWQREMFALGIEDLRRFACDAGKAIAFEVFQSHDLVDDVPSYKALAQRFLLTESTVTNHLAWARRELRRLVLDRIASLTTSPREFAGEVRSLFGGRPGRHAASRAGGRP